MAGDALSMRTINAASSALLVIDFQSRLMPSIEEGVAVLANARLLVDAAALLDVPCLFTEQYPRWLGPTVLSLQPGPAVPTLAKMTFDAGRASGFATALPNRATLVVTGCEAHVCVLQTVLGLLEAGRNVAVARDAIGSRRAESKETALRRMERHGAEIVTAEMVVFEWIGTAEHPRFRDAIALVK